MYRHTVTALLILIATVVIIPASIGRGLWLVISSVALVLWFRSHGILEAWSQRSGGRAARAERIENGTVSA
jgi:hypothetical protein